MPFRRVLAIAVPLSALIAAGLWMSQRPSSPSAPPAPTAIEAPQVASSPTPGFVPAAAPPSAVAHVAAGATVPASLAARVDGWMRSADPHDAMQAYTAIFQCLLARRRTHDAELPPDEPGQDAVTLCGDLRSDQIQQRLNMLEKAARAGERYAAENFIQEGPSGNGLLSDIGTTDPTPPTADWLARRDDYIARALAHCDPLLPSYLGFTQRNRDIRQDAVQYWIGRMSCSDHPATNTTPLADDAQAQAYLDGLAINGWRR
jgi:hypothetical protein